MLDLTCSSRRVIAMLLLICVLGLQQSSACSTSHEQVRHSHRVDSASHASDLHDGDGASAADIVYAGQHGHSHDDDGEPDSHNADNDHHGHNGHTGQGTHGKHGGHGQKFSHVHDHNPGDHTHDIALRPTIKPVTALPPCGWQPAPLAMPAVRHPLPLERPPRYLNA